MRKWTYLVATLLMAGTTATFTGCIDTDEPEGIVDLRGAKSELIKAQAAVKLVEVEWQKAQVAYQELVNKSKELSNQYQEYDNQMHALDVKLKELEVERAQAATEQAKAEAEAKIAEANRDKAYWENKMAEEAEIFKAAMLNYQTQTAQAQEAYDNAMKLIEAGKLLLSDGEKAIIDKAQQRLYVASASLNQYYDALKTAQDEYYDVLVNPSLPTLASLQADLKLAQIAVEKAEILLDEKNNMLALAEDFDAAWDDKILELKKKKSEYESEKSKADVEIATIKTSAEYKAAEAKVAEKTKARKAAKDAYDKAVADSTTQVGAQLDIKEYKSEPINDGLKELFSNSSDFTSLNGYTVSTGVFTYPAVNYTQTAYNADLEIEDEATRTSQASQTLRKVNAWIDALGKYSVDENGVEWNKLALVEKEKAAKTAKEKFDKAKAEWEISAKAVKGTATTVPTTELKKATDAYNTAYAAVVEAVKAYNSAWDAIYKAAYDAAVEKEKASVLEKTYRDNMIAALSPTSKDAWDALSAAEQTTSKLEAILDDTVKQAKAKADANATLAEWLKLEQTVADLASIGEAAGNKALADDKDKKVENAKKALDEAARNALTAVNKVDPAIDAYTDLAANPYGQKLANTVSVEDMTGKEAFYEAEKDKDGNPTGHMKALRSDISADEFTKLSATKLDRTTAEGALAFTSEKAFGSVISAEDRLVEVTEAMVRAYIEQNNNVVLADFGTLGAMMAANDDVQTCKDMIAAADLIKPLKTQMEGVLADLNAEIKANTALMDPFIAKADETRIALKAAKEEVKTAKEEQDALTAEAEANSKKYDELAQDYDGLIGVVQDQIDAINNNVVTGSDVTVESVLNYWKNEVATQEKAVEVAKQEVTAAEKSIELFNKGEYKEAYVIEQKKLALETAQDAYDAAKAIYDTALAQVKSVLETLSK